MDLAFAPAHEIAATVRRRELSPVEVMDATLARVAERGREDLLLQVARAWERVRPFDEWPVEPRPGA